MLILVHTTVESHEDAQQLARGAVGLALAACVHIDRIESVYRWEGQVHAGLEYRLRFKTTAQCAPQLTVWLKAHHPYQLPALYSTQAQDVDPRFMAWVEEGSRAQSGEASGS